MARRRITLAGALAVSLLAVAAGPMGAAQAAGDYTEPAFYFAGTVQAAPLFTTVSRPGFLLSPILTTNLLEADASVASQQKRESLASLLEPGPLGAFPGLLPLLGLPALPYPGYPLTVAASPDDPENHIGLGSVPAGGPDSFGTSALAVGAVFAQATADQTQARGQAYAGGLGLASGVLTVGAVSSDSKITAVSSFKGRARVSIADISILGGLVTIGALTSTTTIEGDGSSPSTSVSEIKVADVQALGMKATIDDTGVHIVGVPGVTVPSVTVLQTLNEQLAAKLAPLKLKIQLLGNQSSSKPADSIAKASSEGRALHITYELPVTNVPIPNIPMVPVSPPVGNGVPDIVALNLGYTSGSVVTGPPIDLSSGGLGLGDTGSPSGDGSTGSAGVSDPSGGSGLDATLPTSGAPIAGGFNPGSAPGPVAVQAPDIPAQTGPNGPSGRKLVFASAVEVGSITSAFGWVLALVLLAGAASIANLRTVRQSLSGLDLRSRLTSH